MRRQLLPLMILMLAGPAVGQPAQTAPTVPVPAAPAAPAPAASAPAAPTQAAPDNDELEKAVAALAGETRQLIAGLGPVARTRLTEILLPLLPDARAAFIASLADQPISEQAAVIRLFARLDRDQGERQAAWLIIIGAKFYPTFVAFAATLPPGGPYDPMDPVPACAALDDPQFPPDALTRCVEAAAMMDDAEPQPAGPGMVPAPPGTAPWQAQLLRGGASALSVLDPRARARARAVSGDRRPWWQLLHICGGAVLDGGWVITAAHCIGDWRGRNAAFFDGRRIRLGSLLISDGGQIWRIDAVVRHGDYRAAKSGDDIALLRLAPGPHGTVEEPIAAVALPENAPSRIRPPPGQPLRLTGWGVTGVTTSGGDERSMDGELQQFSELLRVGSINLLQTSACNSNPQFRSRGLVLGPGQMCAGSQDGIDACKGDSGGPLVWMRKTGAGKAAPILVGLVSHGPGCGLPKTPAAYADVQYYASWVAAARAQAQAGRIIDFVPGRCRHDGVDTPCAAPAAAAGARR